MFRLLSETAFAQETPETVDRARTLDQTISEVHATLTSRVSSAD
jgi:hypothetical protein